MKKNILYREKLGFSIGNGEWFYEGDIVNISTKKPARGGGKFIRRH